MKNTIIAVIVIAVVVVAGLLLWNWSNRSEVATEPDATNTPPAADNTGANEDNEDGDEDNDQAEEDNRPTSVIGTSAGGHDILAYHFGQGGTELLFVGGIHGGYSWNTTLVARQLIDHLEENPNAVPDNVRVTVIPVLNPDGLDKVTGSVTGSFTVADVSADTSIQVSGRFNGNDVDLNRNFDCDWQAQGVWQSRTVSGGSAPFSEPEAAAIRDYVAANRPAAALAWYSAAGGVYASSCGGGISTETRAIMNAYANASGYPARDNFTAYKVTGDMMDWLAKNDIPAISVLLTNHTDVEWNKNRAGIEALLEHYSE